jgi:hypothetical protein
MIVRSIAALSAWLAPTLARADADLYKGDDLSLTGTLSGAVAAFRVNNVDFGRKYGILPVSFQAFL